MKIPGPVISRPNVPPFTTPEATVAPMPTLSPISHLTKSVSNFFLWFYQMQSKGTDSLEIVVLCSGTCREVTVLDCGSKFLDSLQEIRRKFSLQHCDLQVRIRGVQDTVHLRCGYDNHM